MNEIKFMYCSALLWNYFGDSVWFIVLVLVCVFMCVLKTIILWKKDMNCFLCMVNSYCSFPSTETDSFQNEWWYCYVLLIKWLIVYVCCCFYSLLFIVNQYSNSVLSLWNCALSLLPFFLSSFSLYSNAFCPLHT